MQRFIDTIKSKPNLAGQLRTLGIMPNIHDHVVDEGHFRGLFKQVLSLCRGIDAIMLHSHLWECSNPLLQSPESERHLLQLSLLNITGEEFRTFVRNFDHYANLQVLELSMRMGLAFEAEAERSFPGSITFPSLHTLVLGELSWYASGVVLEWELPSLRELGLYGGLQEDLYPLILQSYQRLQFLDVAAEALLHDFLHDVAQAPPHLKNVTLRMTAVCSRPPTNSAMKLFFQNIVTLGICQLTEIRNIGYEWAEFVSDPTYMPHLRSVLTDMTFDSYCEYREDPSSPVIEFLRWLEEVLSSRGVAIKGAMGDYSSFYLLNETPSRLACPCFVVDWCSSPYQHPSEGYQWNINF